MKLAVIPNGDLNKYKNADALIIGLEKFAVNVFCMDFSKIEELSLGKQEIFVAINKNIHNNEIEELTKYLKKLSKINIKGIIYADVAVLQINNEEDLKLNLIWSQEHLTTNYHTINYWQSAGAKGAFVSNDITKREILEIGNNVNGLLFVQVFGYIPIYVSRRHALKNYYDAFKFNDNSSINYISKEGNDYPIIDNNEATMVYSNNILCALEECLEYTNYEYGVINFFNIFTNEEKIIDIFKTVTKDNLKEYIEFIKSNYDNIDSCFLYNETIYKVK